MYDFIQMGVATGEILLPRPDIAPDRWAVIACDQFTSEPQYWHEVQRHVAGSPSMLNVIYPECFLSEGESRIEPIKAHMHEYLQHHLQPSHDGFILVERQTTAGARLGLLMMVDLEQYDFSPNSHSLIRPTEQTVPDRIPPRVKIRKGAPLESPHVMLLIDDPRKLLIEPAYAARDRFKLLYDFDLMLGGGHIRGWALDEGAMSDARGALSDLYDRCDGLLFAVGDGNHSLATARQCWLDMKDALSESEKACHPARFALVEVCNLYDPALVFEPIHRAVFGASSAQLSHDFVMWCRKKSMSLTAASDERAHMYLLGAPVSIENSINPLPIAVLQAFLDEWCAEHPETTLDYIHGDDALDALGARGACCIKLRAMNKVSLFPAIRTSGALPRKTFSLGEARDKRYYLECRALISQ